MNEDEQQNKEIEKNPNDNISQPEIKPQEVLSDTSQHEPLKENTDGNLIETPKKKITNKKFYHISFSLIAVLFVVFTIVVYQFGYDYQSVSKLLLGYIGISTDSSQKIDKISEVDTQPINSCGDNMVKLVKTSSTIGGSGTSCFSNTGDSNYTDFGTAVSTVSCPEGMIKSQSGNTATKTVTVSCVRSSSNSTASKSSSNEYELNQKATFSDGISITITKFERNYLPTYTYSENYTYTYKPSSGKEYVTITVKIDNNSGETYDYGNTYGWRIQDADKFQYDEALFVLTNDTDLLGNGHLGNGGTVSGKIIYEIPSGLSGLKLIIGTATFNLE